MNEKNRTALFIVLSFLILVFSILFGMELNNKLYDPEFCNSCHEMQTYYSSYANPENGSILRTHELKCIQCHSSKNVYGAKKELLTEIITYDLDIPGNFSKNDLKPDCLKCHMPESPVHSNLNNSTCIDCHWAHSQNVSYNQANHSLKVNLGKHMEKKCQDCHGMNFEIPKCIECHTGHGEQKLSNEQCLACHSDPHVPKIPVSTRNIPRKQLKNNSSIFKGNLTFSVCKPCHEDQYTNLTSLPTTHVDMGTCTKCHQWHGEIPKCGKCHPGMMTKRHPKTFKCNTCHIWSEVMVTCQDCHGRTHEWSGMTAVINPK